MNRSDQQQHHEDSFEPVEGSPESADESTKDARQDGPFVAKLVDASSEAAVEETIRVGSPFRESSVAKPSLSGEAAYADYGPFLYIAMGSSVAASIVLLFAAAGSWWFPPGGALVAILGVILSIVGVFSNRRFRLMAIASLPIHAGLFVLSYSRSLTG